MMALGEETTFLHPQIVEKARKDRVMPGKTFAFYCIVFACGLIEAAYVIWWRENWFDAFLSSTAMALILLPVFIRREFKFVSEMEREVEIDLRAQMIASNERLRVARERDAAEHAADVTFTKWLYEENARLVGENRDLQQKYLPFSPAGRERVKGRYVSSKPKRQAIDGKKRSAVNSALIAYVETTEGSTAQ